MDLIKILTDDITFALLAGFGLVMVSYFGTSCIHEIRKERNKFLDDMDNLMGRIPSEYRADVCNILKGVKYSQNSLLSCNSIDYLLKKYDNHK